MRTPDEDAWVLAVDVRASEWLVATAGYGGVPVHPPDSAGVAAFDAAASAHSGQAPLAVVVVHPASWDAARVDTVLGEVAEATVRLHWPPPVPLTVPEAVAWRALQFGLVPSRARLAVLDPAAREAGVVDRDGDLLTAVGAPVRLEPGDPDGERGRDALGVRLVALARQALDAAPAGPPFAGVLLAGTLPGRDAEGAELPGLVARLSGRAPLVPGDPARAAVLGAAALAWAAATSTGEGPGPDAAVVPVRQTFAAPVDPTPHARGVSGRSGTPPRPPRLRLWAVILGVLVLVAVAAGLGWHRARTSPSPFTYTCPDGQVVAYSVECPTLAPSAGP